MTSRDQVAADIFPKHEFAGGRLCLDFCNTLSRGPGEGPRDRIDSAAAFSAWSKRLGRGIVPQPGPDELASLREFRRALLGIVDASVENTDQDPANLRVLEAEIHAFRRSERLIPAENGGFSLVETPASPVEKLRHDIARDAAEILVGSEISRIKRCPDDECRRVFYDGSKNLSRRWCAMDDCGA